MSRMFLGLSAPAKVNLFLHVTGRRNDGYHELQSLIVPIGLADVLDFESRDDGAIRRSGDVVGPIEQDLCLRAATLLQQESGTRLGVDIAVEKHVPAGAGLGGGSSDAATTLLALNQIWQLQWSRERLSSLALRLGADLPFFLGNGPALAEGIGERLTPLQWGPCWFALIYPQVSVSTAEIFSSPELTRCTKHLTISDFSALREGSNRKESGVPELFGANDLEPVVRRRYVAVDAAIAHLSRFGPARMTGSGSAVFSVLPTESAAQEAVSGIPETWRGWAVQSMSELPLAAW